MPPALRAHLRNGRVTRIDGETVVFGFRGWEASLNLCQRPDRSKVIEEALSAALGRAVGFRGELVADDSAEPVQDLDDAVAVAMEVFPGSREVED